MRGDVCSMSSLSAPPEGIPTNTGQKPTLSTSMESSGLGPSGQPQGGYTVQFAGGGGGRALLGGRSLLGRRYRLTIGSMDLTLFDGAKPKESYLYANMCRWEPTSDGFNIIVGTDGQKVDFICEEGEAIVHEITAR